MAFDWQRFDGDVRATGPAILEAGEVAGPPAGPFERSRAYPLAVDVGGPDGAEGPVGAVSYAALDPYPGIAGGWWCVAVRFTRLGGAWEPGDETDNSTTQRPFERPAAAENSTESWIDWHSNGGVGDYGDSDEAPRHRSMFFGIAPVSTVRLTVTDETGRTRDLAITPWCGAYVATVDGATSRLTGYDAGGRVLGELAC
jgi:hypothetical protein